MRGAKNNRVIYEDYNTRHAHTQTKCAYLNSYFSGETDIVSGMRKAFFLLFGLITIASLLVPTGAAVAEEDGVLLPILMYHSISESQRGVYFITPAALESDLAELKRRGYTSVTLREVKAFLKGEGELPRKPVLLTFDDGHYDNLYYGFPLLQKQGFTAVLNVIGCFSEYSSTHEKDHVEYSHLTWEEIAYLVRSGVFEIGSHTYGMHSYKPRFGVKRKKGESESEHEQALTADLEKLDRILMEKCGVVPTAFAYPFGAYDDISERVVNARYDAVFTCYERINKLKRGDQSKRFRLWRINRDGTASTAAFLNKHRIL